MFPKLIEAVVQPTLSDCSGEDDTLRALMERVRGGECGALQELYELTVGILFSLARGMLRNAADAEEVICDVYTQVWQTAAVCNRHHSVDQQLRLEEELVPPLHIPSPVRGLNLCNHGRMESIHR